MEGDASNRTVHEDLITRQRREEAFYESYRFFLGADDIGNCLESVFMLDLYAGR